MINKIGTLLTSDQTKICELEEKLDVLLKEAYLREIDREIEPSIKDEALEEEVSGMEGYVERMSVAERRVKRKFREHKTRSNTTSGASTHGSNSGQPSFNHTLTTGF